MSHTQLTLKQRFKIEFLLELNWLKKDIANSIRVAPTTIGREISRNGGDENYDARKAHSKANKRRKVGKRISKKLFVNDFVYLYTEEKLKLYWSPEQISGRLRYDWGVIVCHETIYDFIYSEEVEWKKYLRQKKGKYRRRHGTRAREKKREEAKKNRIDTREGIVEKRERIGDWEGDTIVGGERITGIITHVERSSGYLLGDLFKKKNAELIKDKIVMSSPYFTKPILLKVKRIFCKNIRCLVSNTGVQSFKIIILNFTFNKFFNFGKTLQLLNFLAPLIFESTEE